MTSDEREYFESKISDLHTQIDGLRALITVATAKSTKAFWRDQIEVLKRKLKDLEILLDFERQLQDLQKRQ